MTIQEAADRYRARPAALAGKWGLRVAQTLAILLAVGRGAGYYRTPWLVVFAPTWGYPALCLLIPGLVIAAALVAAVLLFLLKPWLR